MDRNDYHQFQPLLYQVASFRSCPPRTSPGPHRTIFRDYPSVDMVTAQVTAVDLSARQSHARRRAGRLHGSHLVMAAGARPNFWSARRRTSTPFRCTPVADAERLRLHLQELLQCRDRRSAVTA